MEVKFPRGEKHQIPFDPELDIGVELKKLLSEHSKFSMRDLVFINSYGKEFDVSAKMKSLDPPRIFLRKRARGFRIFTKSTKKKSKLMPPPGADHQFLPPLKVELSKHKTHKRKSWKKIRGSKIDKSKMKPDKNDKSHTKDKPVKSKLEKMQPPPEGFKYLLKVLLPGDITTSLTFVDDLNLREVLDKSRAIRIEFPSGEYVAIDSQVLMLLPLNHLF